MLFNGAVGLFAAHRIGPICREAAVSYPLFRKAWMRYPFQVLTFMGGYYCAGMFQTKAFPKMSMSNFRSKDGKNGISPNAYQSNFDLVAKFRLFENDGASASA